MKCLIVLTTSLVLGSAGVDAQLNLAANRIGSRIDVTIEGQFFTSYRFDEHEKYPFLFPVNGPSGASTTSMRNGAFPHHSSLFFSCDYVNGGNYWQDGLHRGSIQSRGPVLESDSGNQIVITDVCDWIRPGAAQPFRDYRRITITAPSPAIRLIDFEITLEAMEDVVIKKNNHSLFSVRMDPDLTPVFGGTMVDTNGEQGEKGTFGKTAPWLACYGARNADVIEGLAILQHPANPGYPAPWFTRDYGFISPTPMYWPEDGKTTRMAKGEKISLAYRVVVFSGSLPSADIPSMFDEFSKIKIRDGQ